MPNKLKKFVATGAAVAALLLNTSVAFAGSEATAEVGDDGNSSSYSQDNDEFKVKNDNNNGSLFNLDLGAGVSGLNFQYGNDDDGMIDTGDTEGEGKSKNYMNSNMTWIADDDEVGSAEAEASVGEDGFAKAEAFDNDFVKVENDNDAEVDNITLGLAVSGLNFQYCNDDNNTIKTGDAEATAKALNEVNSNWTWVDLGHSAEATAEVGDDGNAYAFAQDNDRVLIENDNEADLLNVSVALALTGGNTQEGNDDDNEIDTGSATANSSANNYVNNNITVVSGGGGATATASVGEDGDGGGCGLCESSCSSCEQEECGNKGCFDAIAEAFDDDTFEVVNINEADVTNVSAGVAVSGGNTQTGNDDGGTIQTGDSSGTSCSTNTVNSNWTSIGGEMPEGGDGSCN